MSVERAFVANDGQDATAPGRLRQIGLSMSDRIHSPPKAVLTIGHSNRPLDEFLRLLQANAATLVVDVRKMPGSRRNPQFGRDTFPQALHQADIGYAHMAGLGGLRRRRPDSPNTGWKNASFQGYADYMLMRGSWSDTGSSVHAVGWCSNSLRSMSSKEPREKSFSKARATGGETRKGQSRAASPCA